MFALEYEYTYLVKLLTDNITEAQAIADKNNCNLYKDGKLIYTPNKEVTEC